MVKRRRSADGSRVTTTDAGDGRRQLADGTAVGRWQSGRILVPSSVPTPNCHLPSQLPTANCQLPNSLAVGRRQSYDLSPDGRRQDAGVGKRQTGRLTSADGSRQTADGTANGSRDGRYDCRMPIAVPNPEDLSTLPKSSLPRRPAGRSRCRMPSADCLSSPSRMPIAVCRLPHSAFYPIL